MLGNVKSRCWPISYITADKLRTRKLPRVDIPVTAHME